MGQNQARGWGGGPLGAGLGKAEQIQLTTTVKEDMALPARVRGTRKNGGCKGHGGQNSWAGGKDVNFALLGLR